MVVVPFSLTRGSTSLTPLSSGGLWLAVIMQPTVCPLSFLDRRAARRPTRKTTESRRDLFNRVRVSFRMTFKNSAWYLQSPRVEEQSREGRGDYIYIRFHSELDPTTNVSKAWSHSFQGPAYTCSAVSEHVLRLRMLCRSLEDFLFSSHICPSVGICRVSKELSENRCKEV